MTPKPTPGTPPVVPAARRSPDDSPLLYREHVGSRSSPSSSGSSEANQPLQPCISESKDAETSSDKTQHAIYFSLNIDGSREAVLSDRLPTPPSSPVQTSTPTQASFDAEHRGHWRRPHGGKETKMKLTPQHLELLTRAYVSAPFFRESVCLKREDTWEIRDTCAVDQEGEYLQAESLDMALTDAKKDGEPLRFATAGTWIGSNVLNVKCETFLNAPFGEDFGLDCTFRVEPPMDGNPCRVIMSTIHPVLSRWDGSKIFHLITDLDVTATVTQAIIAELAAQSSVEPSTFDTTPSSPPTTVKTADIDWCALADDLQLEYELDSFIDSACTVFAILNHPSTPTLPLLAPLTSVKSTNQDFLILTTVPRPTPGDAPSRIGVPWISIHLEWKVHEEMRISERRRRAFREEVVGLVAKRAGAGKRCKGEVELAGRMVELECVPLVALEGSREAWVCFVR